MAKRWILRALSLLLPLLATNAWSAPKVPEWLQRVAEAELPAYDAEVPAVVLHDHGLITVDERGRRIESLTYAVRILSREGRTAAVARVAYATDSGRVRDLTAWIVRPAGPPRKLGKKDVLDVAVAANDVYNEARARLIDASNAVAVGEVFGFEAVVEREAAFNQAVWSFQGYLPVRSSRCELSLPPAWTVKGVWFNHAALAPTVTGTTHAWELRDLPYIKPEPAAPGSASLSPRLALSFSPAPGSPVTPAGFETWQDVARWAGALHDPQAVPDETVSIRARELTSALEGDLDRIRAVARFVQRLPYISIQIGMGRYQPHPAAETLAKSYGDCKDKANLMRAMLSAVGIEAYPVLVSGDDPRFVRPEWPSPMQFNHAILAIRTEAAAGLPAAFSHPTLGTLLLFDPTDEHTLPGDLAETEQGGSALLVAGHASLLLTVPTVPAAANRLVRETQARLAATGQLSGRIVESSVGQAAAEERRLWRELPRPDFVRVVERWLSRGIAGVKASRIEATDDESGRFRLEVDFAVERYGQSMQGRLMLFKPALVGRRRSVPLTAPERKLPIVVGAEAYEETARIELPEGFVVDELPTPARVETTFGRYQLEVVEEGGAVLLERHLTTQAATLPAESYAAVREFYQKTMAAEQAPVVLVKK